MFAPVGGSRRFGVGAAVLSASVLLAGCAAGQKAATADERPVVDGATVRIGDCTPATPPAQSSCLTLNAVSIAAPEDAPHYSVGDTARLRVIIVNSASSPDTLIGINTDVATVDVVKSVSDGTVLCDVLDKPTPTVTPQPSPEASATPEPTTTPEPSGEPTATPEASPTATPCVQPEPVSGPITVAAGSRVTAGYNNAEYDIVLKDLKKDLYPAQNAKVTFSFANAGDTTIEVPVHLIEGGYEHAPKIGVSVEHE